MAADGMQIDTPTVLGAFGSMAAVVAFLWRLGRADLAEVRAALEKRIDEERKSHDETREQLIDALKREAELRARVAYLEEEADERRKA